MIFVIWSFTIFALSISFIKDREKTLKALKLSFKALHNLTAGIFGMISLVGLVLAMVPKETLISIFTYKGILGFVIVSLVGAVVTIPAPIAFPLAGSMLKVGASPATLASFITTLTMVGLVTAPLEISYFGKKFTIIRQSLSFFAAIIIGLIMGFFI